MINDFKEQQDKLKEEKDMVSYSLSWLIIIKILKIVILDLFGCSTKN